MEYPAQRNVERQWGIHKNDLPPVGEDPLWWKEFDVPGWRRESFLLS